MFIDRNYTMFTPRRMTCINIELGKANTNRKAWRRFCRQFFSPETPTLTSVALYRYHLLKDPTHPPFSPYTSHRATVPRCFAAGSKAAPVPESSACGSLVPLAGLQFRCGTRFRRWYYSHLRSIIYLYNFGHVTYEERHILHRILKTTAGH